MELLLSRVPLWAMDEHRLGLQPILRTVWGPTGKPLVCPVHPRYEWLYTYAFANPQSGESRFWLVLVLHKEAYQAVMSTLANSVGAGED
ncbi:hypothetical protein [Deinococcus hopiensis]|uniref:hypothetical protein n=1 Tax=Deinococcus hopiensis TaxID=309885 RepID=UPI000A02FEAC|nr:hypothetical protein [Deinococcus hopiensis]